MSTTSANTLPVTVGEDSNNNNTTTKTNGTNIIPSLEEEHIIHNNSFAIVNSAHRIKSELTWYQLVHAEIIGKKGDQTNIIYIRIWVDNKRKIIQTAKNSFLFSVGVMYYFLKYLINSCHQCYAKECPLVWYECKWIEYGWTWYEYGVTQRSS